MLLSSPSRKRKIGKTYSEKEILFFKLFEKDPQKPEKSISVLKVFGKINFHYAGEVTHPSTVSGGCGTVET